MKLASDLDSQSSQVVRQPLQPGFYREVGQEIIGWPGSNLYPKVMVSPMSAGLYFLST